MKRLIAWVDDPAWFRARLIFATAALLVAGGLIGGLLATRSLLAAAVIGYIALVVGTVTALFVSELLVTRQKGQSETR